MKQKERVPPNQKVIQNRFPVLHVGSVPKSNLETWDFRVEGLVGNPLTLTYTEFLKLPSVAVMSDFHCVTGWSLLGLKWEGVSFSAIVGMAKPRDKAHYVMVECEGDYTTSLPIEVLLDDDVLLAYKLDDEFLSPEHGGPVRLVVPRKYAYKSAKWARKLRFTEKQELGYWEQRGYSNSADPWNEERYA